MHARKLVDTFQGSFLGPESIPGDSVQDCRYNRWIGFS